MAVKTRKPGIRTIVTGKVKKLRTILLSKGTRRPVQFSSMQPEVVSSVDSLRSTVPGVSPNSLWISYERDLTEALVKFHPFGKTSLGSAVFVHKMQSQTLPALLSCFNRIAFTMDGGFLPPAELSVVLASQNRSELFIGGGVDQFSKTVTMWRGDLHPLTVPFSAFEKSGDGLEPDFTQFSVTDYGQTVRLGDYEAAADALLYEFDPEYRRRIARERQSTEKSFGASLRRLRKQRGLTRKDFMPDVADKTIARIEHGLVHQIRAKTLNAIARRLNVKPEEIETF